MDIDFKELCKIICPIIKKMPMHWDGKKCILDSEVPIAKKLRSHLKWEASG